MRNIYRIESAEAIGDCANVEFDLEPSCNHLTVHHVRLIRDGVTVSEAREDEFRFIQPEESRHRLVFDGRLRVIHLLEDARPGDVVDIASTTKTTVPPFPEFYSGTLFACAPAGAASLRLAIHFPDSIKLEQQLLADAPKFEVSTTHDGMVSWTLEKKHEPWRQFQYAAPSWYRQTPLLSYSNFPKWESVSRAVAELWTNAIGGELDDPIFTECLTEMNLGELSKEKQIETVIRFVQDEIRYLSLSEGIRSLVPNQPSRTIRKRYGDCKNKSIVLSLLLQKIGVRSSVGLVSTSLRGTVEENLPSPKAFDHAITAIYHEGETYWIDATATGSGGCLGMRMQPRFRKALPIHKDGTGLAEIDDKQNPPSTVRMTETITIEKDHQLVLKIETVMTGHEANSMRSSRNQSGPERFQENLREYTARHYRDATVAAPMEWEDDLADNRLIFREHYHAAAEVEDSPVETMGRHYPILPTLIGERMPSLGNGDLPKSPVALPSPLDLEHSIHFHSHRKVGQWNQTNEKIDGPGFHYTFSSFTKKKSAHFEFTYRTDREHIEENELTEFRKKTNEVYSSLGRGVPVGKNPHRQKARLEYTGMVALSIIVIAALQWNKPTTQRALQQFREWSEKVKASEHAALKSREDSTVVSEITVAERRDSKISDPLAIVENEDREETPLD